MVHMPKSMYTTFFNFHIKWLFTRKEGKVFFCHGWMTERLFENATHAITCSIWKFGSKKLSYFLLTYILDKLFKFKASWYSISVCAYETSLMKPQNKLFIYHHDCIKIPSFKGWQNCSGPFFYWLFLQNILGREQIKGKEWRSLFGQVHLMAPELDSLVNLSIATAAAYYLLIVPFNIEAVTANCKFSLPAY